jgi:hypothetical protein
MASIGEWEVTDDGDSLCLSEPLYYIKTCQAFRKLVLKFTLYKVTFSKIGYKIISVYRYFIALFINLSFLQIFLAIR